MGLCLKQQSSAALYLLNEGGESLSAISSSCRGVVHVDPLPEEILCLLVKTWGVSINVPGLDDSGVHHS